MRSTHTYAVLQVSVAAYDEIRRLLEDVSYQHAFHEDGERVVIDMHGIAIAKDEAEVPGEGRIYPADDGREGWVLEMPAGKLYCRNRAHAEAELRVSRSLRKAVDAA